MILVIDNFDSFAYNLTQAIGALDEEPIVYRNNIPLNKLTSLTPTHLVLSPGPGNPKQAGNLIKIIKYFSDKIPVLGVCLGHQALAEVFGGKTVSAKEIVHGKTSMISHDGKTIFKNLKNPFEATRYHSLVVDKKSLPSCFEISASSNETIMAIRHKELPLEGVQFHPESFLTSEGNKLLKNFLKIK